MMNFDNQDYFDFTTKDELPQGSSSDKRKCPHCDKPIPVDSLFCLFCGDPISQGKKNKHVAVAVILFLIAVLLWIFVL